MLTQYKHLYF